MAASMDREDFGSTKTEILSKLEGESIYERVKEHLEIISGTSNDIAETETSRRWLSWARQERDLRVIAADVPARILPNDYEGVLYDVKTFVKYGPDDKIYDNNKAIRDRVARGNCFLELSNKAPRVMCALQAMKKFTGGLGDDDDRDSGESGDDSVWQRYFTKPLEETDFVVTTEKANGEAAHLSCIEVDGEYVLCGGSKNVHLLFRNKGDIGRYVEPRYRIATEVCTTVMDFLDTMKTEEKARLLAFLVHSRYTAVFEILSPLHQHVVNLSQLERPVLKFITWTKCELEPSEKLQHLNIVPPDVGIEIAKSLGLDPVTYHVVQMSELQDRMKQIRLGFNSEGEVLYFLDKAGAVIGLLKKKTTWYIMCRAIREKIKSACQRSNQRPNTFSKSKSLNQIEKRIDEIQHWLSLEHETTAQWKELGQKCLKWTLHELDLGHISLDEVRDQFPVCWCKFLTATGESDQFEVKLITRNGANR